MSKVRGGQHTLVERLGYKVQGNASRLGTWTEGDKAELLSLVAELQPCGATDWEVIADKLGRWSKARPPPSVIRSDGIHHQSARAYWMESFRQSVSGTKAPALSRIARSL